LIGIAGVVTVVTGVLSIAEGFRAVLIQGGAEASPSCSAVAQPT